MTKGESMKKKISIVLLFLLVFLMVTGCSLFSNEKVIKEDGYSITLTKDFTKGQIEEFDVFYQTQTVGFTSLKETFPELEKIDITENSTLAEYGEKVRSANNILKRFQESSDGNYMYVDYEKIVELKPFYYYTVIKKGNDGFWIFNFFCSKDDKDKELSNFEKYASTIKFE